MKKKISCFCLWAVFAASACGPMVDSEALGELLASPPTSVLENASDTTEDPRTGSLDDLGALPSDEAGEDSDVELGEESEGPNSESDQAGSESSSDPDQEEDHQRDSDSRSSSDEGVREVDAPSGEEELLSLELDSEEDRLEEEEDLTEEALLGRFEA